MIKLTPEGSIAERLDYARQLILPLAGDPVSVVLQTAEDERGRLVGKLSVVADEAEPVVAADVPLDVPMWTVMTTYMRLVILVHSARSGVTTPHQREMVSDAIANLWNLGPLQARAVADQVLPSQLVLAD